MNKRNSIIDSNAWMQDWLSEDAIVSRRSINTVHAPNGGRMESRHAVAEYIAAASEGEWTLFEIADWYVLVKERNPDLQVLLGEPTLTFPAGVVPEQCPLHLQEWLALFDLLRRLPAEVRRLISAAAGQRLERTLGEVLRLAERAHMAAELEAAGSRR